MDLDQFINVVTLIQAFWLFIVKLPGRQEPGGAGDGLTGGERLIPSLEHDPF